MTTSTTPSSPPANAEQCYFFRLPPELRVLVYSDVLSAFDIIRDKGLQPRVIRPAMLNTCRTIQEEFIPVYKHHLGMIALEYATTTTQTIIECSDLVETARATETDLRAAHVVASAVSLHSRKIAESFLAYIEAIKEEAKHLSQIFGSTKELMLPVSAESAVADVRQAHEALKTQITF